ncbi:hypothetical protein [Streptomyces sp. NPDC052107]|uniref:hypothetical protein n=1 Tax=Streptomyces sp. NPDC052107 TaxID=3155632 RepID=UPI003423EEC0
MPIRTHTARDTGAARPDAKAAVPVTRGTFRDDRADACCALGVEGVARGAPAVSLTRHGDDDTAADGRLGIRRSTGTSTLARSATAPGAVVGAGLSPGGTPAPVAALRDDRAGGRLVLGVEGVTRGNPAVAVPLLLKAA